MLGLQVGLTKPSLFEFLRKCYNAQNNNYNIVLGFITQINVINVTGSRKMRKEDYTGGKVVFYQIKSEKPLCKLC